MIRKLLVQPHVVTRYQEDHTYFFNTHTMDDLQEKMNGKRTRFVSAKIARAPSNISSSDDSTTVKAGQKKMKKPGAVTPAAKSKTYVAATKIVDIKQRKIKQEDVKSTHVRSSGPKLVVKSTHVNSSTPKIVEKSTQDNFAKPNIVEKSARVNSSKSKLVAKSTHVISSKSKIGEKSTHANSVKPKTVARATSKTGSQTMRSNQTAIASTNNAVALKSTSAKKAKNNEGASQDFENRASTKLPSKIPSAENDEDCYKVTSPAPSWKAKVRTYSQPTRTPRPKPLTEVQINKAEESFQSYHSKVIESLRAEAANKLTKKLNNYEESEELKTKRTLIKADELRPNTGPTKLGGKHVNDNGGQLTQQEKEDCYTAEVDDSQEDYSQAGRVGPAPTSGASADNCSKLIRVVNNTYATSGYDSSAQTDDDDYTEVDLRTRRKMQDLIEENKRLRILNLDLQSKVLMNCQKVVATITNVEEAARVNMRERINKGLDMPVGFVDDREDKIHAGSGWWISKTKYDILRLKRKLTPAMFMARVAVLIFSEEVMKKSSVTGTMSNVDKKRCRDENRPCIPKPALKPSGLTAVLSISNFWMREKGLSEDDITKHLSTCNTQIAKKIAEMNRPPRKPRNKENNVSQGKRKRSREIIEDTDTSEDEDENDPTAIEDDNDGPAVSIKKRSMMSKEERPRDNVEEDEPQQPASKNDDDTISRSNKPRIISVELLQERRKTLPNSNKEASDTENDMTYSEDPAYVDSLYDVEDDSLRLLIDTDDAADSETDCDAQDTKNEEDSEHDKVVENEQTAEEKEEDTEYCDNDDQVVEDEETEEDENEEDHDNVENDSRKDDEDEERGDDAEDYIDDDAETIKLSVHEEDDDRGFESSYEEEEASEG